MKSYLTYALLLFSISSSAFIGPFPPGGSSSSSGGDSSGLSNPVTISQGGTGQTTAQAAIDALLPSQAGNNGEFLTTNGSTSSWASVTATTPGGSDTQIQYNNGGVFGADAGMTYDDSTRTSTFTPTGSPVTGLTLDLASTTAVTGNGLKIAGGGKVAGNVFRVEAAYSGASNISATSNAITGTSTSGFLWGLRSDNVVACTGDANGFNIGGEMCSGAVGVARGTGNGTNTGLYGVGYGALHNFGGAFQGVAAKAGATPRTFGVHATASGENSAQTVGIVTKIATSNSSGLETYNPGISGALIADNGDTVFNIFTALDNGSSVFQVRDGGATVIGANGAIASHTLNGQLNGGSVFPVRIVQKVNTFTPGASITLDPTTGNTFQYVIAQQSSILPPTVCTDGQKITIRLKASGANRIVNLHTGSAGAFRFGSDISALSDITSGKTDYVGAECNAADNRWDVVAYTKGF